MRRAAVWMAWTAGGIAVAVIAVVFASRFGSDPTLAPSPLIGKPAPAIAVTAIEGGGPITLDDYADSVVVVNFWAPWCVPCRDEHPLLLAAAETYGPSGVVVLGIAYDSREDDVIEYLDELGRGYPVAMDEGSRAAIAFGVRGVPETFFIDRSGRVAAKVTGPIDGPILTTTIDAILAGEVLGQP